MNAKKAIATIGLTGVLGLTTLGSITPAMAAENGGNEHQWNSVSQSAHDKDKGESNREAAHAHSYGQQWKQWKMTHVSPSVTDPIENDPKIETPITTAPKVDTPVTAPVTTPVTAPVEVSPKVDVPIGNVSTGDNLNGNSVLGSTLNDDKVGETNPTVGENILNGMPKFF